MIVSITGDALVARSIDRYVGAMIRERTCQVSVVCQLLVLGHF